MATLQISIGTRKQSGKESGHGTDRHIIGHCTPMQSVFSRLHGRSTYAMTTNSAQMNKEELKATFLPIILIISKTPQATDLIAYSALRPQTRAGVSEDMGRRDLPPTRRPTAEDNDTAYSWVTPRLANSILIAGWAIDWQTTVGQLCLIGDGRKKRTQHTIHSIAEAIPKLSVMRSLIIVSSYRTIRVSWALCGKVGYSQNSLTW
jgi:hypothetical protein